MQAPFKAGGSWSAPFPFFAEGRQLVFFEEVPEEASPRTRISLLETDSEGQVAIVRPLIEEEETLEAPFVFNWQDRFWLIAVRAGVPWVYRCLRWPECWQAQEPLPVPASGRCTGLSLYRHSGRWWLWLTQLAETAADTALPIASTAASDANGCQCGSDGGEHLRLYSAKHPLGMRWERHPLTDCLAPPLAATYPFAPEGEAGSAVSAAPAATGATAVRQNGGKPCLHPPSAACLYGAAKPADTPASMEGGEGGGGDGLWLPSAGAVFTDSMGRLLRPVRIMEPKGGADDGMLGAIGINHITALTVATYAETPLHRFAPLAGNGATRTFNVGEGCVWADAVA